MAFYDSMESLPGLTLHLHTYSNSLSAQRAKILAITLFGLSLGWVLSLVHTPVFLCLPLVSPECPGGGGENK